MGLNVECTLQQAPVEIVLWTSTEITTRELEARPLTGLLGKSPYTTTYFRVPLSPRGSTLMGGAYQ